MAAKRLRQHIELNVRRHVLYSDQGLLHLWKFVLVYSERTISNDPNITQDQYILAFRLNIALSDYLYNDKVDNNVEVFRSSVFHNKSNFLHTACRTLIIYTAIARDKSRFEPKEFIDLDSAFLETYGYTIEDYIVTVFAIYSIFTTRLSDVIKPSWWQSVSHTFSTTTIKDLAEMVLKPMMFTQQEAVEELEPTLDQPWDFNFFLKKPLFNLADDSVIPISGPLLENALADRLYWDIRECFPPQDTKFQRFFGRPFELYVQDVFRSSCN